MAASALRADSTLSPTLVLSGTGLVMSRVRAGLETIYDLTLLKQCATMSGEEHLQNSDNLLLKRCESLQDDSFNLAFPFKLEDDFYFSVQSENAKPHFSSDACNSTNH